MRADLLALIHKTQNLDWLLLTKRPELWKTELVRAKLFVQETTYDMKYPVALWILDWLVGRPPANVWVGTSVENQRRADERIPELLKIPARVRFLSCEPLLGPIEFSDVTRRADAGERLGRKALAYIDWVICGGESGAFAREMDVAWARSLRDQCKAAGVAFFMKQLGGVSNKRGDLEDFPEDLRVREFPK